MSQAAAETNGDYHHGEMDISEHVAAFKLFNAMSKWGSLAVAVIVVTFTLAFCTSAGLGSGILAGILLLALGVFFLRSKTSSGH